MIKVGIIGTGWFSKVHAGILTGMEGVQVQAVCGTSQAKAESMAIDYNNAKAYDSLANMLDAGQLDAAYICVPPMSHGAIEQQLIERGIPFLVEKPLGLDTETPRRILKQIQEKSLITSVGYHFRYKTTTQQLKDKLHKQTIGMAIGQWMGSMPQVPWWRNQETSGGQFIEQTTHMVDLLRYCAGEIEEVYAAYGSRVMPHTYENVTVSDIGTVILKLRSGVLANISNTCILPNNVSRTGLTFYTNEGLLDWDPSRLEVSGQSEKYEITDKSDPYFAENEAFIHAVRTGDTSRILSDYKDAFETQRVTHAALQSAANGLPVQLD